MLPEKNNVSEVFVLVKASPNPSAKYGETVCCAGITPEGKWLRLYPIQFRNLQKDRKFKRWDKIRFEWRLPTDDEREESRWVSDDKIEIVASLKKSERASFLSSLVVDSLDKELSEGRTLALIRPENVRFTHKKKTQKSLEEEKVKFESYKKQNDFFLGRELKIQDPCPYEFKFSYHTKDGKRTNTCIDWETDAMFFNFRKRYGEDQALKLMKETFNELYPQQGMVFTMGTHRRWKDKWLLNGILRLNKSDQMVLPI